MLEADKSGYLETDKHDNTILYINGKMGPKSSVSVVFFCTVDECEKPQITLSYVKPSRCDSHLADLADATGLAQGADRSHVALVPGAELRRVVVGRWFQCDAGMDFPRGLKMVALTMQ